MDDPYSHTMCIKDISNKNADWEQGKSNIKLTIYDIHINMITNS